MSVHETRLLRIRARPRIFDRKGETLASLGLAGLLMVLFLTAAATVALYDMDSMRARVETFFRIKLDNPDFLTADARYTRETAAEMERKLLQTEDGLPHQAAPTETPAPVTRVLERPPLLEDHAPPVPAPEASPSQVPFGEVERTAGLGAITPAVPVLAVEKVGLAPPPAPGLETLHTSGRAGGLLGRPGETAFAPPPVEMPAAPTERTLHPNGEATAFHLPDSAGSLSRRLVEERPAAGYPSLDRDIEARFTVYRAPGAAEAFFRLELALRPESTLPTIAKDTLFLIDISQSISLRELTRIREAVVAHLRSLSPEDRWNVVLFSEQDYTLHPDTPFVSAREVDAEAVADFIDRRRGERRTDVFRAVRTILARVPRSNRPCNVFLVSDGKATTGTSEVKWIVHDFHRMKRQNFSIFTFNAGEGGNLYLLRLLSYRSRGFLGREPDLDQVPAALRAFLQRYDQPVLTDVVASYTNIRTNEVYPEVLPNLYRGNPITFWGRTEPGKTVALRVAGRGRAGPREFFFRAVVPPGDASQPQIVRQWARGKAHALIARLADDPDDEPLRQQVLALARTHGLDEIVEMVESKSWRLPIPWPLRSDDGK